MRIDQILKEKEVTISFEVFPPKTDDKYAAVEEAARQIAALRPDFMSVTYGAGGGTSAYTLDIAKNIKSLYDYGYINLQRHSRHRYCQGFCHTGRFCDAVCRVVYHGLPAHLIQ